MIKIVPNILSKSIEDFASQQARLEHFNEIDIDIAIEPFTEESTVNLNDSVDLLTKDFKKEYVFHLMVESPSTYIDQILNSKLNVKLIYVHQESDLDFMASADSKLKKILGISIKKESKLKSLEFYNQFKSVQLMTGTFGGQGKSFDEYSLSKSLELRGMGFDKEIGVDGGVNLQSAKIIKDYPIGRVSVGSFFSKSKNPDLDKMKLDLALNIKTN